MKARPAPSPIPKDSQDGCFRLQRCNDRVCCAILCERWAMATHSPLDMLIGQAASPDGYALHLGPYHSPSFKREVTARAVKAFVRRAQRSVGTGRACGQVAGHQRRELFERTPIHVPLEIDHFFCGLPVVHPFPVIKFWLTSRVKAHITFGAQQAQQEPDLFLANTQLRGVLADKSSRQGVTQPTSRTAHDGNTAWK